MALVGNNTVYRLLKNSEKTARGESEKQVHLSDVNDEMGKERWNSIYKKKKWGN